MIKNKSIRLKPYIDYSCQLIKFKTISSVFNDSEKIRYIDFTFTS